jgi:hypothetical protein
MARFTMSALVPLVTGVVAEGAETGVFRVRHPELTTKFLLAALETDNAKLRRNIVIALRRLADEDTP